jgi:hypothetical protein
VDQCFAGARGIAHYQLRQTLAGTVHLRYVPESSSGGGDNLNEATARLESLLESAVITESVPTLLPESSGKFRLTCKMAE